MEVRGGAQARRSGIFIDRSAVSILVLAIGVIGCLGIQLAALRTARQSALQTAAVHLAADIAERMRFAALVDDGSESLAQLDYRTNETGAQAEPVESCLQTECDLQQRTKAELAQWQQRIDSALPQGHVRICRDAQPWRAQSGAYSWDCIGGNTDPLVIKLAWRRTSEWTAAGTANDQAPALVLAVAVPSDLK